MYRSWPKLNQGGSKYYYCLSMGTFKGGKFCVFFDNFPILNPPLKYAIIAHFRVFRHFRGIFRACTRTQNRRKIIFNPLCPFFIFIFDRIIFLNSKKTMCQVFLIWSNYGILTILQYFICNGEKDGVLVQIREI